MSELIERVPPLTVGEHGPRAGDDAARVREAVPGIEPVTQGIGHMLAALGELVGSPATTAHVRVGALKIEYQHLDRPKGAIVARWADRADGGAEPSQTGPTRVVAPGPTENGGRAHAPGEWEQGVGASRSDAHGEALTHFCREAEDAAGRGRHARAAIAYRSASAEADEVGRHDLANHLLRLAGKHYLAGAESRETPPRGIRQAYEVAAKCFLQAGNLALAETSIQRARSLDDVLG